MSNKYIKTRGVGAGGSNTNATGLSYENLTDLSSEYEIISSNKHMNTIRFNINNKYEYICVNKNKLYLYMKSINKQNNEIKLAHGCKKPDECYINEKNKTIFIIEKKFQQVSGSVCEKIQTPDFKIWQYSRTFPEYKIVYIYCLSDWFKKIVKQN